MYYDKSGKKLDELEDFLKLYSDQKYKRVAADQVGTFWVSTVWLGIDHNFYMSGPPVIFETMIFRRADNKPNHFEDYQERYCTEAEALEGHKRACAEVDNYVKNSGDS